MTLIKFNNRNRLFPRNTTPLQSMFNTEDFFSDDFFTEDSLMPAMNVKENDANFEVELAVPGYSKKDFEVTIDDDGLHICAERSSEKEENEEEYTSKEFSYNSFKRSLKLPNMINQDGDVNATYKDGILKLTLLKIQPKEISKKTIEIK